MKIEELVEVARGLGRYARPVFSIESYHAGEKYSDAIYRRIHVDEEWLLEQKEYLRGRFFTFEPIRYDNYRETMEYSVRVFDAGVVFVAVVDIEAVAKLWAITRGEE